MKMNGILLRALLFVSLSMGFVLWAQPTSSSVLPLVLPKDVSWPDRVIVHWHAAPGRAQLAAPRSLSVTWLDDQPLVFLGKEAQLPQSVMGRTTAWVSLSDGTRTLLTREVFPRKDVIQLKHRQTPESRKGAGTPLDAGYLAQVVNYLAGNLSQLEIRADSYAITSLFPVIDGDGRWVGPQSNVVGPEGPQGPQGNQGPVGSAGPEGAVGPEGEQGAAGAQGPQGLQGEEGPIGAQGPVGAQGPQGADGPQGAQGAEGDQGLQGDAGPQGDPGPQGEQGAVGPMGADGPAGLAGPVGPEGPSGVAASVRRTFTVAPGQAVSAGDVLALVGDVVQTGFADGNDSFFLGEPFYLPPYNNIFNATLVRGIALSATHVLFVYQTQATPSHFVTVVGELMGDSIIFGTPALIVTQDMRSIDLARLDDTRALLIYTNLDFINPPVTQAMVITTTGTQATVGPATLLATGFSALNAASAICLNNQTCVLTYEEGTLRTVVASITGDAISLGPVDDSLGVSNSAAGTVALSASQFALVLDSTSGIRVGTLAGNNVSYGQAYPHSFTNAIIAKQGSNTLILTGNGRAQAASISGEVVSYGSTFLLTDMFNPINIAVFDQNRIGFIYGKSSIFKQVVLQSATRDNVQLSYGPTQLQGRSFANYNGIVALDANRALSFVQADDYLPEIRFTSMVSGRLIGIAAGNAAAGEAVEVILEGISDSHSGLTPGALYYAAKDGSLTTVPTTIKVGIAISSSELLLNKDSLEQTALR